MNILEWMAMLLRGKQRAEPSTPMVMARAPTPLHEFGNVEDAWTYFCRRLGLPGRMDEQDRAGRLSADSSLAAFVRAHPGAFEQRFLAGLPELAQRTRQDRWGNESELEYFLDGFWYFRKTMEAIDPRAGLLMLSHVHRYHRAARGLFFDHHAGYSDGGEFFARRLGVERLDMLDLPRGMRDVLRSRITGDPSPDILPADLDNMSPDDIAAIFEAYTGLPIVELEEMLLPDRVSETGFLAPGEHLGEVIATDARRLRELGVSRHALADRLALALWWHEGPYERLEALPEMSDDLGGVRANAAKLTELTRRAGLESEEDAPFEVLEMSTYAGFQEDPFFWGGHSSRRDFVVHSRRHPHLQISGSELAVPLIHDACFFEGRVPYRIDPELAARVLGLLE